MEKKLSVKLKGEIVSSVFYILFGICLTFFTEQTIYVICKVIFGLVMLGTGIYHICIYVLDKEKANILDMFTGVIVLVLGGFLFTTPQVIVKLLPYLLSAFVLVDSIWTLKGAWKLKKLGNNNWRAILIGSFAFVAAGIVIMVFPFSNIRYTAVTAGCVMLANGIVDLVFLFLIRNGIKKGVNVETKPEVTLSPETDAGAEQPTAAPAEEVDDGEPEESLEDAVVINGRWKNVAEETESPAAEIRAAAEIDAVQETLPEETVSVKEEPAQTLSALLAEETEEEPEEWVD